MVVLLTPGPINSAYYEHSFLADRMGVELVEGARPRRARRGRLYAHHRRAETRRRHLQPARRRFPGSAGIPRTNPALGVPGLIAAYRAGNVTIANAPGTGVADDKAIYSYVPEIVRFYMGEEPILKNVPTWRCREGEAMSYVVDNLQELVVKQVNGSGGYGMLVGPHSSAEMCEHFRHLIRANPENYVAQPTLALSTSPVFTQSGLAPRHVDLRPSC